MSITNFEVSIFDSAPIRFRADLPPAPNLQTDSRIAKDGTVVEHTGVATLHGKNDCNRAAYVTIDGELSQIYQRFIFRSTFHRVVTCARAGSWPFTIRVEPTTGTFARGEASVKFTASARATAGQATTQGERRHRVRLFATASARVVDVSRSSAALETASCGRCSAPWGAIARARR
jgi:hypothetical protein